MKDFFKSILQDERGRQSTKRLLAILGTLFLCITLVINISVKGACTPSAEIVSAIEFIVIACVSATSLDKFSKRTDTTDTTN